MENNTISVVNAAGVLKEILEMVNIFLPGISQRMFTSVNNPFTLYCKYGSHFKNSHLGMAHNGWYPNSLL